MADPNNGGSGNMFFAQFARPPKPRGPSFVFLQIHTTGQKSRALGHEAERACWSLQVLNNQWVSARSNVGTRIAVPDDRLEPDIDVKPFYPPKLVYNDSRIFKCDPCADGYPDTMNFSWVHPNWAYCAVPRATIQDLTFTLLDGDTMNPMNM